MDKFQLHLGDCLELMRGIPSGSVDMVMADLPYGTTACKWDSVIPMGRLWLEYDRVITNGSPVVLTASQPFSSYLTMSKPDWFRHEWVWLKNRGTNPFQAKTAPMKKHEVVLIFSREPSRFFPQTRKGKPYRGFSSVTSKMGEVYDANSVHKDNPDGILNPVTPLVVDCEFGMHPTQKPVALMEYLIRTYTTEGQTVLDNTMGSGTTGVACAKNGRKFIGIERDPGYFNIAYERISDAYGVPMEFP